MATRVGGASWTVNIAPRAALALAGMLLVCAAAWFAASWIDTGNDSSCGAVIYPGMWVDNGGPNTCRTTMAIRSAISATAGTVGVVFLVIAAAAKGPIPPIRAGLILATATATSTALLLVNEAVRSDGAL